MQGAECGVRDAGCGVRSAERSMETGYKRLKIWQLVKIVYTKIRLFPKEEQFALCDQLRRAVVSIPSNIAEGYGRDTHKDFH